MSDSLEKLCQYIWKEIACDHVRVEIIHIKDEATGKLAADPGVKTAYAQKGFKWKTLSNDPTTGKRA